MQILFNTFLFALMLLFLAVMTKIPETKVTKPDVQVAAPTPKREVVTLTKADLKCLADNIYHEARGEGVMGMEAVAHVTLNRLRTDSFPSTVCGVVYQPYQFSWTLMKEKVGVYEKAVYNQAIEIAKFVAEKGDDFTDGSLFFHTTSIRRPRWASSMEESIVVNNHIFYKEKRKQN